MRWADFLVLVRTQSGGRGQQAKVVTDDVQIPIMAAKTDQTASSGQGRRFLHVFPSFGVGGVELRMASILNHFGGRRADHPIVALDGRCDAGARLSPDAGVCFVDPPEAKAGLAGRLAAIRRFLRAQRPDALLTYNWGAIEWALAHRLSPFCTHVHLESGFGRDEAERSLRRRDLFRRLALGKIAHLIVPSRRLVEIARKRWRIPEARIVHIPNGVDCERFARPPSPGAIPGFSKRAGEMIIGTIAPLRPEKNLGSLIRAFAAAGLDNARLVIVGGGPERTRLEELADAVGQGDRLIWTGQMSRPEDIIGLFDIYALSSVTEQMPNTVLQAMAAGLPVAGVDVGDVASMVAPENRAWIVPGDDDAALAAALTRLAGDEDLRRRLGQANRARARERFSEARMFARYGEVLGL